MLVALLLRNGQREAFQIRRIDVVVMMLLLVLSMLLLPCEVQRTLESNIEKNPIASRDGICDGRHS